MRLALPAKKSGALRKALEMPLESSEPRPEGFIRRAYRATGTRCDVLLNATVLDVENVVTRSKFLHAAGEAAVAGHIDRGFENRSAARTRRNIIAVDVISYFGAVAGCCSHKWHRQEEWMFIQLHDRDALPGVKVTLVHTSADESE
jgi:hypothetical protein